MYPHGELFEDEEGRHAKKRMGGVAVEHCFPPLLYHLPFSCHRYGKDQSPRRMARKGILVRDRFGHHHTSRSSNLAACAAVGSEV